MNQDYVTQLRLQLREAALREERQSPLTRRAARVRGRLPGPLPVVAALAVVLLAIAVAIGTLSLRTEPAPTAPRLVDTLPIADGLTSISSGFGSAWATDLGRGRVLRIDPGTGRVVARIPAAALFGTGTGAGNGETVVAAGAGAVWALTGDLESGGRRGPIALLRIDPQGNRVVKRIPMRTPGGRNFSALQVDIVQGRVWVIGGGGALRIDPATNRPDRFIPVGPATQIVVTDGDALAVLTPDGRLREIDARAGKPRYELRVRRSSATRIYRGRAGTVLLVDANVLRSIESANGNELWRAQLPGKLFGIAPDGADRLWVFAARAPDRHDLLVRLDGATGARLGAVELREPGIAGLARVGRETWVASPDGRISVIR